MHQTCHSKTTEEVLQRQKLPGYGVFLECCRDAQSGLGELFARIGNSHIRMTDKFGNLKDKAVIEQPEERLRMPDFKRVDMWGSLPCAPWTSWLRMSVRRYGLHWLSYLQKVDAKAC